MIYIYTHLYLYTSIYKHVLNVVNFSLKMLELEVKRTLHVGRVREGIWAKRRAWEGRKGMGAGISVWRSWYVYIDIYWAVVNLARVGLFLNLARVGW